MKKLLSLVPLLALASFSRAQTYDAYAAFVDSYATGNNPDGAWAFGWTEGLYGSFNPFDSRTDFGGDFERTWYSRTNNFGSTPAISYNGSGTVLDGGSYRFDTDCIQMIGIGPTGTQYADAVWTAPAAGTYSISGRFFGQERGVSADFHVLVAGGDQFSGSITNLSQNENFAGVFTLAAGDVVAFAAGPNGNPALHANHIGLSASIEAVPEPASMAALAAGGLVLLRRRRRS